MKSVLRKFVRRALPTVVVIGLMTATGFGQESPDTLDVALGDPLFDGSGIMLAQQEPRMQGRMQGRMRGPGMMPPMDSGIQRKHIEQLRMLKLLEVLDLTEDQEPQFLMAFKGMRKAMRGIDDRKRTIINRLSKELRAEKPDIRQINNLVDSVFMIETLKRESMQKFIDSARGILSPLQVGRLLVFTERFEFEMLERVREFRDRQAPKGPRPGETDDSQ